MPGSHLFMNLPISVLHQQCRESALNAAEGITEEELAVTPVELLVEQIVADKVPKRIELDVANHTVSREVAPSPAQRVRVIGSIAMPDADGGQVHSVHLHLHISSTGTQQLFIVQPSQWISAPPQALISSNEVTLTVADANLDPALAKQYLLDEEQKLMQWVQ